MFDKIWFPESRKSLNPEKLKVIKAVLNKIPKLSLSVRKIIEMAGDKGVDSKELVEVASADPVLASKILMMVNSSYYGITHKIDNLRLAIVLLGFNEVRNIAIQFSFMQTLGDAKIKQVYNAKNLWAHSYLVSICAESFSGDDDPKRAGVLMTMGILHDIGKFALHSIGVMMEKRGIKPESGKEFSPVVPLLLNEQNLFGVNHNIIGGMLAEKWNLSEKTSAVIEFHHFPSFYTIEEIDSEYIEDIAIISLSDFIVNKITGEERHLCEPHKSFFDLLGLASPLDKNITKELESTLNKAKEYIRDLS